MILLSQSSRPAIGIAREAPAPLASGFAFALAQPTSRTWGPLATQPSFAQTPKLHLSGCPVSLPETTEGNSFEQASRLLLLAFDAPLRSLGHVIAIKLTREARSRLVSSQTAHPLQKKASAAAELPCRRRSPRLTTNNVLSKRRKPVRASPASSISSGRPAASGAARHDPPGELQLWRRWHLL